MHIPLNPLVARRHFANPESYGADTPKNLDQKALHPASYRRSVSVSGKCNKPLPHQDIIVDTALAVG